MALILRDPLAPELTQLRLIELRRVFTIQLVL